MNLKDPIPAPAEVLIPEARDHQKQRYLWTGLLATMAALVLAALISGALVLFSSSTGGSRAQPPTAPAALTRGTTYVYFRPVLCAAAAYSAGASGAATGPPSCSPASDLSVSNLAVTPGRSPIGFTYNTIAPDNALAGVPSTSRSADAASNTVLLPVSHNALAYGDRRFVLGPAQMTNASVASASAVRSQTGQWVVDYTMNSSSGAARWDLVAEQNFHQMLGIDFDGTVVSTPIIQPTQSSFSSLEGHGAISGNLTRSEAVALARALTSHRD